MVHGFCNLRTHKDRQQECHSPHQVSILIILYIVLIYNTHNMYILMVKSLVI